jgi:MFS family permease
MTILWGTAWAITYVAGQAWAGAAALIAFGVAMFVFGIGETLLAPTIPALVNDLAPDEARGRYNGANTVAWTVGFIMGPILSATLLDAGLAGVLVVVLLAGCAAAAVLALRLEERLGAAVNLVPVGSRGPEPVAGFEEPRG